MKFLRARAEKIDVMRYLLQQGVSHNIADADGRSLIASASGSVHPVWKAVYDG